MPKNWPHSSIGLIKSGDVWAWLGLGLAWWGLGLCKIVGQALSPPWGLGLAQLGLSPGLLGVNLNFIDSKLYIVLKVVGMDICIIDKIKNNLSTISYHYPLQLQHPLTVFCFKVMMTGACISHNSFMYWKKILNVSTWHWRLGETSPTYVQLLHLRYFFTLLFKIHCSKGGWKNSFTL